MSVHLTKEHGRSERAIALALMAAMLEAGDRARTAPPEGAVIPPLDPPYQYAQRAADLLTAAEYQVEHVPQLPAREHHTRPSTEEERLAAQSKFERMRQLEQRFEYGRRLVIQELGSVADARLDELACAKAGLSADQFAALRDWWA